MHEVNVTSHDVVEAHATALNWKGTLLSNHVAKRWIAVRHFDLKGLCQPQRPLRSKLLLQLTPWLAMCLLNNIPVQSPAVYERCMDNTSRSMFYPLLMCVYVLLSEQHQPPFSPAATEKTGHDHYNITKYVHAFIRTNVPEEIETHLSQTSMLLIVVHVFILTQWFVNHSSAHNFQFPVCLSFPFAQPVCLYPSWVDMRSLCSCFVSTLLLAENFVQRPPCPMVFITARVHPGETPASYVCQGTGASGCNLASCMYVWYFYNGHTL